jgi:hypothetical protein
MTAAVGARAGFLARAIALPAVHRSGACRRRGHRFPWMFTVWMSADRKIGTAAHFIGFDNYVKLATIRSKTVGHTIYFTVLVPGTIAALIFHRSSRFAACCARSSPCR